MALHTAVRPNHKALHHDEYKRQQEPCMTAMALESFVTGCELTRQVYYLLQAIRAPLIVAVLQAYMSVASMSLQQELKVIFPHLTRLICCGQPAVRGAVAALLSAHLPALLPM